MKTTTITIMGAEYKVGFDFSVSLQYEEDHNAVLDLANMDSLNAQLRLIYSVLKSFNQGFNTQMKDFAHKMQLSDLKTANDAIAPLIEEFYAIPAMAEQHVEGAGTGDGEKNA